MKTREATQKDLKRWVELRHQLWPDSPMESLGQEATSLLMSPDEVCFLAVDDSGIPLGFAEAAIHQALSGLYGHLEGWYVRPEYRGRGMGRELVGCIEQWCLHRAIRILTSDTTPDCPLSPDAHKRSGFKKICEFTIFMKELDRG